MEQDMATYSSKPSGDREGDDPAKLPDNGEDCGYDAIMSAVSWTIDTSSDLRYGKTFYRDERPSNHSKTFAHVDKSPNRDGELEVYPS